MKLIRFFANFGGRIPRKTFWLANIAVFIIDVIVATIAAATAEAFAGETAGSVTMHIVTLAFFYPQFVIALERAHDLNMTDRTIYAWYIALIVDYAVIRLTLWAWGTFTQNIYSLVALAFVLAFIFAVGLVTIVLLIELGFRRGTRGPNKWSAHRPPAQWRHRAMVSLARRYQRTIRRRHHRECSLSACDGPQCCGFGAGYEGRTTRYVGWNTGMKRNLFVISMVAAAVALRIWM